MVGGLKRLSELAVRGSLASRTLIRIFDGQKRPGSRQAEKTLMDRERLSKWSGAVLF